MLGLQAALLGQNGITGNKAWQIKGVNHQIREGSYVTIIKVTLPAPGAQLNPDENIGGNDSGMKIENKTEPNPDPSKCEVNQ